MGQLSLKLAAWVTAICAMLEFFVGVSCNSMALTTDSGYMASDAAALFMAIWAIKSSKVRSCMMWLSSIMMLMVVFYMANAAISAWSNPEPMAGVGVLLVSTVGLLINIWVSKGLLGMKNDRNIQVAHLHVICDMLGSAIAVISGSLALIGFDAKVDIILSLISAFGVGLATLILMYKMLQVSYYCQPNVESN